MNKFRMIAAALASTVAFAPPVFAEWTKVGEGVNGNTFYIDYDTIKENNGYVYYWDLNDKLKPSKDGHLSSKAYIQGDCKLFRFQYLSISYHKEPMGGGTGETVTYDDDGWNYPPPKSVAEIKLEQVCNR